MTGPRRVGRQAGPPPAVPKPAPPATPLGAEAAPAAPGNQGGSAAPAERATASAERAEGRGAETTQPARQSRSGKRRRRRRGGAAKLPQRTIVFVGPMAAGKTSLGRRVAKELGIPFVDSDVLFVREHGAITDFFAAHGEQEFRRIEAEIIAAELAEPGTRLLALGGGAVITDSTRELLANHPTVLLMTTQEAVLRTANLSRRPLLRDDPSAWGRILAERKPLYREVADVTFRTDRAGKEQLTRRVVQWVRAYARKERAAGQRAAGPNDRGAERAAGTRTAGAERPRTDAGNEEE